MMMIMALRASDMMSASVAAAMLRRAMRTPATDAARLIAMATQGAGKAARKVESSGGRAVDASTMEELVGIYHRHLAAVYSYRRIVPIDGEFQGRNLPQGVSIWHGNGRIGMALYRRSMMRAGKEARSMLWGHGAERITFVPVTAIAGEADGDAASYQLQAAYRLESSGVASAWQTHGGMGETGKPHGTARLALRHEYQDDRLRVAIYWARQGGQRWQGTLNSSLRLLGAVYQSACGKGITGLLALGYTIDAEDRAERRRQSQRLAKAIARLRAEVTGGEVEIEREPSSVANTVAYLALIAGGSGEKAGAMSTVVYAPAAARLMARLGVPQSPTTAPVSAAGVADRVARRRADAARTHSTARLLSVEPERTAIPGVATRIAPSRAIPGRTVQLVSTLPLEDASTVRGRTVRLTPYAESLLEHGACGYCPGLANSTR